MAQLISARIPDETAREIERLARAGHSGKTEVVRKLILQGLVLARRRRAIELYRMHKVTLWKAAEVAGLPLWRFLEEVKQERIPVDYTLEDAKREVKTVFG